MAQDYYTCDKCGETVAAVYDSVTWTNPQGKEIDVIPEGKQYCRVDADAALPPEAPGLDTSHGKMLRGESAKNTPDNALN